jgi:hypothetical protein
VTYAQLKFNGALLSSMSPTESNLYDGSVLQVATSAITSTGSFSTKFVHI